MRKLSLKKFKQLVQEHRVFWARKEVVRTDLKHDIAF